MKKIASLFLILAITKCSLGQTANWAEHVAPILYQNCTNCHHTGGLAPFPLITYSNATSYSSSIQSDVNSKKMPPWSPDPHYSRLAHERILSQADINTINDWVNGGTPQGNLSLAPTPPTYNNNTQIGTADLSLTIPTYTSPATTFDEYRCFVLPTGIGVDKYITAMEVLPGNSAIVHHVLVFYDTTNVCPALDAADPGPGYTDFGGTGSADSKLIGAWVPGTQPMFFPTGFGMRLPANAKIILQIHYPQGSSGQSDSTKINFKLTTSPVRNMFMDAVLSHSVNMTDGPLFIPANQTKIFHEQYTVPLDVTIMNVAPHMHLIGKSIKAYGVQPNGDTLKFINIPDWDFHWQGAFEFRNLMKVPVGTVLKSEAFYDNTSANPENPSSPPVNVALGESTTDEMMLVFFTYTYYLPGDENVVIDNSPLINLASAINEIQGEQVNLTMYPNPVGELLMVNCEWLIGNAKIQLYDVMGREMNIPSTNLKSHISILTSNLPSGVYFLKITDEKGNSRNSKFVKE